MAIVPHRSEPPVVGASLRAPGAILLVSCYELGHQPLGIASPAAFLRRAGFDPATLDLSIESIDEAAVRRAHLICVSVPMHTALRLGVRAVGRIREMNPGAHVCFHGLYAALNAEWLLAHGGDSAIGGESEAALVELAEALEAGQPPDVPGVSLPGRPAAPRLERLAFPEPAREALPPLARYARLEHRGAHGLVGYVEATRGCRHLCLHCPIPPVYHGRLFVVPADIVIADIARLVAMGATHVTFGDPDFLNAPTHSLRIARALHAAHPALTFDFTAKVEHVLRHRALLPGLVANGALFMVSAVESLSDTVLANLAKGHTRADVFEAIRITRAAGLALRPSLVAFTPWTSLEDYLDVLDVVEGEDLVDHVDPVQYAIRLLVPPGSLLLDHEALRPHLGGFDAAAFGHRWTHPDPRMDRLHRDVSDRVGHATRTGEDARATFAAVRALALAAAGRPGAASASAGAEDAAARRRRVPRLTEPWFC
jgi:radical SAM superfamily enzyme YgiQ (UPF0313 family)